jgi:predicted ArsR family transcriptional regulator
VGGDQADGAGRAHVLQALRRGRRRLSAEDLAAEVGLSPTTTRFHLRNLVKDGVVLREKDAQSTGPGRPRLLFRALPVEAVEPGPAYARLAAVLAEELAAVAGSGAALAAGRRWGRALRYDQEAKNLLDGQELPVDRMVEVLEEGGFAPLLTDDGTTVELHSCPYRELARTQADVVCTVHLGLVRSLPPHSNSASRVRLVPVLDGSGPCLVRLAAPDDTTKE